MALLEPFRGEHTVRLADTDTAGVVYFARALEWFHALYEDWLASVGFALGDHLPNSELLLPIVSAEVTHEKPLRLGDRLDLELRVARVGTSSYTLNYEAHRTGERCVSSTMTHVCMSPKTERSEELPAGLRYQLERLASGRE